MDGGFPYFALLPGVEMAGVEVPVADLVQQVRAVVAGGEPVCAAGTERAPLGQAEQRGRQARDRRQPPWLGPVQPGDRPEQAPGVGVLRVVEDVPAGAPL